MREKLLQRIFCLMERENVTISDLAKTTGISDTKLRLILSFSEYCPTAFDVARIAVAFKVPMEYLVGISDNQNMFWYDENLCSNPGIVAMEKEESF